MKADTSVGEFFSGVTRTLETHPALLEAAHREIVADLRHQLTIASMQLTHARFEHRLERMARMDAEMRLAVNEGRIAVAKRIAGELAELPAGVDAALKGVTREGGR